MTDREKVELDRRAKQLLDAGVVLGIAIFVVGLYLVWHPLAPLVGGALFALGCGFAGYDKMRRGDR